MKLRRFAILDMDGCLWADDDDLKAACAEISQLRQTEEGAASELFLIDRERGPLTDAGELKAPPVLRRGLRE